MNRNKSIILVLFALVVLSAWFFYNNAEKKKYRSQVVLAKELHKAMSTMMEDLSQARASSVKGVPADGRWYHAILFRIKNNGPIQYRLSGRAGDNLERVNNGVTFVVANHMGVLSFRRRGDASIIEVQLQARNDLSLISNFRVRMKE